MNLYELRDALTHLGNDCLMFTQSPGIFDVITNFILHPLPLLGYQLSNNALSSIILRYHNKRGTVPFDIFIQILVRVIVMFGKLNCPFVEKIKTKKKYFVIQLLVLELLWIHPLLRRRGLRSGSTFLSD